MKKLFILDDNEELLEIMHRLLSPQYNITTCKDLGAAMAGINRDLPDMIILDYNFGRNNTEDIVSMLKGRVLSSSVPLILFSGLPDVKELSQRLGMAGYLEKPSSISKIRSYIKDIFATTFKEDGLRSPAEIS